MSPIGSRDLLWIAFAIQQVMAANWNLVDESIEEVASKAGGVGHRQPNILIEMKHLDTRPFDAGGRC